VILILILIQLHLTEAAALFKQLPKFLGKNEENTVPKQV
jgi:hypothetical protein